jgi:hypothetical protein
MFRIPDANAREAPTGRVTQQTMHLLAANGPPTPYRLDLVAIEQVTSQQVRPQETREELILALLDQDADEQGLTLAIGQADPDDRGQLLIGGGGTQGASTSEGDAAAQVWAAAEVRMQLTEAWIACAMVISQFNGQVLSKIKEMEIKVGLVKGDCLL